MALPPHLRPLLEAQSYDHPCDDIELIETHISWVLLTGRFVYKLKKPVKYSFIDFSTLELREYFCHEEVRCNRAFSPELYLGVVCVTRQSDGSVRMNGPGEVIEWAVQMQQFDGRMQLDRMLQRKSLSVAMLREFGGTLAALHARLPRHNGRADEVEQRLLGPVEDNFTEIAGTDLQAAHDAELRDTLQASRSLALRLHGLMCERLESGWVRECHGDLHLANLALINKQVSAFDCLEFNANLRWIDTFSDVAFLFMDCHVRNRADLAYGFVDGYLDVSSDYQGVQLLAYFAAYRSVVRAKVASLRWQQQADEDARQRFLDHVQWANRWLSRPVGRLVLMCGLSGSGKSYLAQRLLEVLPAIRLRSDVARKSLAGLVSGETSDSPIDAGLYTPQRSDEVFGYLREVGRALLLDGENVIVDATFIEHDRRAEFFRMAAQLSAEVVVLYCHAPEAVLRDRVHARQLAGGDASEATLAVLEAQLVRQQPPQDAEPVIRVDTSTAFTKDRLEDLARTILQR